MSSEMVGVVLCVALTMTMGATAFWVVGWCNGDQLKTPEPCKSTLATSFGASPKDSPGDPCEGCTSEPTEDAKAVKYCRPIVAARVVLGMRCAIIPNPNPTLYGGL